jgi:hypothetical protein
MEGVGAKNAGHGRKANTLPYFFLYTKHIIILLDYRDFSSFSTTHMALL